MNKFRRKAVNEVMKKIEELQSEMDEVLEGIEVLRDEEQEYLDNIPENLQGSERYELAEAAVDALTSAYDTFEEAKDQLDDVISSLEESTM